MKCKQEQSLSEYHKDKNRSDGLYVYCKSCGRIYSKEYYKKNKEKMDQQSKRWAEENPDAWKEMQRRSDAKRAEKKKIYDEKRKFIRRENRLKNVYGITTEQYNNLLEKQKYSCAICEKPAEKEKQALHIDHNHKTGEIRGLLCNFCNSRFVGRHNDPDRFEKAAQYLREGTGWFVPKLKKKRKKK